MGIEVQPTIPDPEMPRGTAEAPRPVDSAALLGTKGEVELYYRYRLNSHVELTPDVQWIRQPGGNAAAPTVKVIGLRAKLGF